MMLISRKRRPADIYQVMNGTAYATDQRRDSYQTWQNSVGIYTVPWPIYTIATASTADLV
jgi:hypothetical protein